MRLTLPQRIKLIREVFLFALEETESFKDKKHFGADLAYLLWAIACAEDEKAFVDWSKEGNESKPELCTLMETHFSKGHSVWKFIKL